MDAPRYLAGDSFLGRRDPRVLIVVPALALIVVAQIQDVRLMAVAALAALAYYAAARIPFEAVRANWAFIAIFVIVLAGINGLIVGAQDNRATELVTLPLIHLSVSTASASYTATMLLRFVAIAATGFPLAFAIRPGDLAVAFARLGVPDRFAYAIDLTFRFLPTISANLRETTAAQRLRGYEISRTRNPVRRIREVGPLVVPVTVGAFIDAEDVADALDLRGFGAGHRTWLRTLQFDAADWAIVAAFAVAAVVATGASLTGQMPGMWVW